MDSHPEFPVLFSPLSVGPMTLRNRIVNSAHQTGFARNGTYTDQLIEYHTERARGGAALIVSQATSVTGDYLDLYNSSDDIVPAYQAVSTAVRAHGAHYSAELYHPGSQGEYTGRGAEAFVAPSSLPASYLGGRWRVAHALTDAEIHGIIDAFRAAAARCRQGGLSGIELHFAHGNLAEQFMFQRTNRRSDDWGGSLENRLRFTNLVTAAVREAAGPDLAVGARLTAARLDPGEPSDLDMAEIIGTIGSWGMLDYVSLTMGHYSDALNTARNIPNMTFRPGLWRRYGKLVKSVVDVPVFLVGRINHPRTAEDLLETGSCDAVVMARALIADPHLPEKARTGRTRAIRPCVGAMNCMDSLEKGRGIRCIHNPRVGHELQMGEDVEATAADVKRILVIGGGPAGLEAARVAAARGHHVTLVEQATQLGGQIRAAAAVPGRAELATIVQWLEQECRATGVAIRTGTGVTAELIQAEQPDVIVSAAGAIYPDGPPPPEGVRRLSMEQALAGQFANARVAVYDELSDWQGFNVIRVLADHGCHVHYLTPEQFPGAALEVTNWRLEYQQLAERGVDFRPITEIVDTAGGIHIRTGYASRIEALPDVDAMVWIGAPTPNDSALAALPEGSATVLTIGDAYAPRGVEQAILDARQTLLTI